MSSKLFTIILRKKNYYKLLTINNLSIFLMLLFTLNLTAQVNNKAQEDFFNSSVVHVVSSQKNSVKPIKSSQKRKKDLDTDVFYADEAIYIGSGGLLTIKTKRVQLQGQILGLGELQFATTDTISLITKHAIEVAHVSVVNTVLSLETKLEIKGELVLDNAKIQLNDADLFTQQSVVFLNNAKINANKTGIWVSATQYKQSLPPITELNTFAKQIVVGKITDFITAISIISKKERNNTFFKSSFYDGLNPKNQKPPPKYS